MSSLRAKHWQARRCSGGMSLTSASLISSLVILPSWREGFLFLFRQRGAVRPIVAEDLDLDEAGAAFAVLAVERDRNLVGLGDGEDRAAIARHGIDRHVTRHGRRREGDIGHKSLPEWRSAPRGRGRAAEIPGGRVTASLQRRVMGGEPIRRAPHSPTRFRTAWTMPARGRGHPADRCDNCGCFATRVSAGRLECLTGTG